MNFDHLNKAAEQITKQNQREREVQEEILVTLRSIDNKLSILIEKDKK